MKISMKILGWNITDTSENILTHVVSAIRIHQSDFLLTIIKFAENSIDIYLSQYYFLVYM